MLRGQHHNHIAFTIQCGQKFCVAGISKVCTILQRLFVDWSGAERSRFPSLNKAHASFNRVDHAAVAAAYGVKSWRVEDPTTLHAVLKDAIDHDGPTLVDVIAQPLEESAAPVRRWMG